MNMENPSYISRLRREWLIESPQLTGTLARDPYPDLLLVLDANLLSGYDVINIGDGLKKLSVDDLFYWLEVNDQIDIIAQFTKSPAGLFVELVGKKPDALTDVSDFYQLIVKDAGTMIFSGSMITSQGLDMWKNLLASGRKLIAYDSKNPVNYLEINSGTDFDNYVSVDPKFTQYRLLLAESNKQRTLAKTSFDFLRTYMLSFHITDFNDPRFL